MDGLWLSDTVQGTSPWTIAVGATSGQATKVKVQPGAAYRLLPPKDAAQNTAARKNQKISHRQEQDDLILSTPDCDELVLEGFYAHAQSNAPALLTLNELDGVERVLGAVEQGVSPASNDAKSLLCVNDQSAESASQGTTDKDPGSEWLSVIGANTLIGLAPLLLLSGGGGSGGSSTSGVIGSTSRQAPIITSVTDDVGAVTGAVSSGGSSDDAQLVVRVSLTGTGAVANDTVQLYNSTSAIAGAVTLSATDISNGYVDITTNTLSDATTYVLNAKVIDAAGNASAASPSHVVTIDTTAPLSPSMAGLTDDVGAITGAVAAGGRSDDTHLVMRVSLTGSNAQANDTVQLYDGTSAIASAVTLSATDISNGYVDITTNTLSDATSYAFNAKVIDAAGNASVASASHTVTIDTTAPVAPAITSVTDDVGSITGAVSNGGRSDDTQLLVRVSLTGTHAQANDTVQLYDNTSAIASAATLSATDIGHGYVDITTNALSSATTYAFNAKVIDVAGNASAASASHAVTIDTTAPAAPSITRVMDDVGTITGAVAEGGVTDDTVLVVKVSLAGTSAVANDTVQLYDGSTPLGNPVTLTSAHILGAAVDLNTPLLSSGVTHDLSAKLINIAGTASAASLHYQVSVDTTGPSVSAIAFSDTSLKTGETSGVTVTFSEAVTGFDNSDVTAQNGSLSALSSADGGVTWTGTFTPTDNLEDTSNVVSLAASYTDVAGNSGSTATSGNYAIDTLAPTATITLNDSALKAGDTSEVTITFSEAVSGFDNSDVTVQNGSLSALSSTDGGVTWTGTFTPSVNLEDTSNVVSLASSYTDVAGNSGSIASSANYSVDTLAPTASISLNDSALKAGDTSDVTIVFSEAVSGFDNSDVTVQNGNLSALSSTDGGVTWTGTFTPTANLESTNNLVTLASSYTDVAGNSGNTATSANYAIDTLAPTASISLSDSALKIGDTSLVTITFSEAVMGFDNSDVTVQNGSLSTLSSADGGVTWTGTFTPTTNLEDASNVVSLAASYSDVAGNSGSTATSANYAIDTLAPTLTITTPLSNTDNVLNLTELTAIAGSSFLLQGTAVGLEVGARYSVNLNQHTYSGTVTTANTWSVDIPEADMNALVHGNDYTLQVNAQDLAGNDAVAVSETLQVRLAPPDTPTIQVVNTNSLTPTLSGSALKLINPNDPSSAQLPLQAGDAFTVTVHGASYTYTVGGGSNPAALSYDATAKTWSLALPAGVITADGRYDVAVSVSAVGYPVANDISSNELTVDRVAPALSMNTFAGDNTLNAQEVTGNLTLSGTADTSEAGRTVSISGFNSGTYHATVQADGSWQVTVLAADLALVANAGTVQASLLDVYGNTASLSRSIVVDKVLPVVSRVVDDLAGTANAATANVAYTYVFSEAVTGLSSSDFTVTHGSISSITGSGTTWVVNVTPQAGVDGDVITLVLKGAGVTDLAGNPNITYTSNSQALDTVSPTLAISSNVSTLKAGQTATISFNFSEAPTGFAAGDVVTSNGTLSGLAVTTDPKVYTATFTPTANLASGSASITVASAAYTDAAGNSGAAGTTPSISIDTLAPTLAITSSASTLKAGQTATIRFTFSEAPSGFATSDVTTTNGTLSGLAVTANPKVYTATFTPTADLASGSASITVGSATYTDAAGNSGGAGTTPSISIDTLAPTVSGVAITDATYDQHNTLNVGDLVRVTVAMSEATTVNTTGGTPQLALNIGGTTVNANYAWGSGSNALVFQYTVQAGQTDANGISIAADSLLLNGGTLKDAAGNNALITHSSVPDNATYLVDTTAPTVDNVEITGAIGVQNSILNADDLVRVTVTMSETTTVDTTGGTPQLALNIGGTTVYANYVWGSGSKALVFQYTVQPGQTDADGISIDMNSLSLNGGTLRDAAGNNATLTHNPVLNNPSILVDTTAPTVSRVAITDATYDQNNTLSAGDVVRVTVTMSEATTVNTTGGTPQLALNIGGTTVYADYVSGTRSNALMFQYTVQPGQTDANGISIAADSLSLNGGTLRDAAGNNALITHSSVPDNATYLVDTTAPTVDNVEITGAIGVQNSILNADDLVRVTVTMSEVTTVDTTGGTPQLALNIGGTTVYANYVSGTRSNALVFQYTVQPGQTDANGISLAANALSLNGGTLKDVAGNAATLTTGLVLDNINYMVDTTPPTATLVSTGSIASSSNATVKSTELGTAYLVNAANSVVTEADILALDTAQWSSSTITAANTNTAVALSGMAAGTVKLYTVDAAGNLSAAASTSIAVTGTIEFVELGSTHSGDTGISNTDFITRIQTPNSIRVHFVTNVITGSNASSYEISVNGGLTYTVASYVHSKEVLITSPTLLMGTSSVVVRHKESDGSYTEIYNHAYTVDQTGPTITTVTDDVTAAVTNGAIDFTVTFNEAIQGTTVSTSRFTATNGTVNSVTSLGNNQYTVHVTPTANVASGNVALSLVGAGLTDAAGNTAANASLSGLDSQAIDTKVPTVSGVAITSASDILHSTFNADDVVSATVTMSEATTVDTTSGTPRLALNIGGTTVYASYASGSGSTALLFNYTLLAGQNDPNGISIDVNSLSPNGGTLKDAAGNNATLTHAAVSNNASYVVDTTAPTTLSTLTLTPSGGTVVTNTLNASNTAMAFAATVGAGQATGGKAEFYIGADLIGTDIAIGAGDTTVTYTTSDGTPTTAELQAAITAGGQFSVILYDAAGNSLSATGPSLTRDLVGPTVTGARITSVTDNVGSILGGVTSGGRSDDTQLVVRVNLAGTGVVANDKVQLYDNTSVIAGAVTLNAIDISNGYVDITTNTLSDATTYAFNVKMVDVAGNASGASASYTVTIDTTAPTAPSITSVTDNVGNITGTISSGGVSDDTVLAVKVNLATTSAVANDTVQLYDGITTLGTAVTLSAGDITAGFVIINTPTLSNATTYAFKAQVIDVAGNASTAALTSHTVTIDTTAPTTLSTLTLTPSGGTVVANTLNATNTAMAFAATVGAGQATGGKAEFYIGADFIGTDNAIAVGDTTVTYTTSDGTPTTAELQAAITAGGQFSVILYDAAGNSLSATGPSLTRDLVGPTVTGARITSVTDNVGSILGGVTSGGRSDDTQLVVRVNLAGTGVVANDKVQLYDNTSVIAGAVTLNAIDISNGYVDITTNTLSDATTYAFNVKMVDVAGNASGASASYTVTIDTTAPTAPSITSVTDDVGSVTGAVSSGGRSDDTQLVVRVSLTGTGALANDSVQLYDTTTAIATLASLSATDISNGYVDITTNTLSNATTYAFKAQVIDVAGNASTAALTSHTVTIDTTAPTTLSTLTLTPSGGTVVTNTLNATNTAMAFAATVGAGQATGGKAEFYIGADLIGTDIAIGAGDTTVTYTTSDGTPTTAELQTAITAGGQFSVILYDAAGNSLSATGPSLTRDLVGPTVTNVLITSATNIQNNTLNANDEVSVTVTMSEATTVDTTGGTPQLALNIGGTTVYASYASGSGNTALVFKYTVLATQNDIDGISIAVDSLSLNGGTLKDAAGNAATLTHASVLDNASYLVDTTAAVFTSTASVVVTDSGLGIASGTTLYTATTNESASYTLSGADAALFNLTSGALSFKTAQSYSAPTDAGADNVYNVTVTATDLAGNTSTQAVDVTARALVSLAVVASGTGGFVINGECASDQSGFSVSNAGDVNGDGLADLIVGAPSSSGIAGTNSGRSYVVFGSSLGSAINLLDVTAETGGFVINGASGGDSAGYSVSGAGDVNGDGLADVIVSANGAVLSGAGTNTGASYVVFGKKTNTAINLSDVAAGTGGFLIKGKSYTSSGTSVSAAGDVNNDGLADLIVGARFGDPIALTAASNAGSSYVVFGKADTATVNLSAIDTTGVAVGGFVINGQGSSDQSGISVSSAGDVNGDGFADVIVGAMYSDPASGADAGRSYVVFGKASTTMVDLSAVALGTGGFVINGQGASDQSGFAVSGAGDVNGDGLADVIVGAKLSDPSAGTDAGRSYVVFGKTSTTGIDLSAVALGTGGFVINGQSAGDQSAYSVSGAGDVNGDGLADLIVGAVFSDPNSLTNAGRSYVVFGKTSTTGIDLSAVAMGIGGFVITGETTQDQSGVSVSTAGDVNGDGLADLLVGARLSDLGGGVDAGRSYVIFGSTSGVFWHTGVDQMGTSGDNSLTSTGNQTLVAGAGNDTLTASATTGADVLYGGAGDDTFVVTAAMVTALQSGFGAGGNTTQLARIDGGSGIDTLRLSSGLGFDFRNLNGQHMSQTDNPPRVASIEIIDLQSDTAVNALSLRAEQVLASSEMNVFNSSNTTYDSGTALAASIAKVQTMIWGDAGDTVNIGISGWTQLDTVVRYQGHTLNVYNSTSYAAQLLIEQTIVNASHVL